MAGRHEKMRLGIVLPTWVGDACLATPTLRSLRAAFPQAHVVGIMRPVIREVLDSAWGDAPAWLDEHVLFSKRSQPGSVTRWGLIGELRRQRVKLMVLLTNSWWSAAVARFSGAQRIVGYDRDARGWLLTDRLQAPRDGQRWQPISPIDYYLKLADWLGADTSNRAMQLGVTPQDQSLADQLWQQLGFDRQCPTVVINSGAANMATRLWPADKVRTLAQRIAGEIGWQVLLHCGPGEREATNQLARAADDRRIQSMGLAQELPVGLSKGVLQQAACVVSTDSGPRHMAVALNRPVISLFGPTDPSWTRTYNLPESHLEQTLACRPCYKARCPLGHHRCMEEISVDRVLSAIHARAVHSAAA